jgi:thioredoxin 1
MKKLTSSSELHTGLNVVKFSANWCGPCKMYAPIMENASKQFTDVNFYSVDVDEQSNLAAEFGVTNLPTTVVIKNGKIVEKFIGLRPLVEVARIIESVRK